MQLHDSTATESTSTCLVEAALELIDGKWKGVVLYHLLVEGTLRFNELRRRAPRCTQRMLTNQLRQLEMDGLIGRKVYAEVPPKVEYSLTDKGRGLAPVISALRAWAKTHLLDTGDGPPAASASGCSPAFLAGGSAPNAGPGTHPAGASPA